MMFTVNGEPLMLTLSHVILRDPVLVVLIGVRKISYLFNTSLYCESPREKMRLHANLTCDSIETIKELCLKYEARYPIHNVPIDVSRDDDKEVLNCGLQGHVWYELLRVCVNELRDLKGFNC